eukprot:Clim_evm5s225 gene=Clim_evmTU5s225
MKAVTLTSFNRGDPSKGIEVRDVPPPAANSLKKGELLVKMLYSPVNPSDINVCEGTYLMVPAGLPAPVGLEGYGRIEAVGPDTTGFAAGDDVAVKGSMPLKECTEHNNGGPKWGGGLWSEYIVAPTSNCFKVGLPADASETRQAAAAMLHVNPCTAYAMLKWVVDLEPGDWIIQNLGTSAIAAAVIAVAKKMGLHVVTTVRRPESVDEIKALGSDIVVVDDTPYAKDVIPQIRSKGTGKAKLGLNGVGGESCKEMAKCLEEFAYVLTYGAMSLKPLTIPNGFLIFKGMTFQGFHLGMYMPRKSQEEIQIMYDYLIAMIKEGTLDVPIDAFFSLDQGKECVARAFESARGGKAVFRCQ